MKPKILNPVCILLHLSSKHSKTKMYPNIIIVPAQIKNINKSIKKMILISKNLQDYLDNQIDLKIWKKSVIYPVKRDPSFKILKGFLGEKGIFLNIYNWLGFKSIRFPFQVKLSQAVNVSIGAVWGFLLISI
ncbi:MAG: hypothetical protein CM15mP65_00010 [Crocinitomicaceae bacterium]|nr:MAG: hypothetical protein CM15mP65_00010 [Crocinitomicaceae bacterium]